MFTKEESWTMTETEKVVEIIKLVEVWRLANFEGCTCSKFNIRGVDVEISCGKGGPRVIEVSARSCDDHNLRAIGEEVAQQVEVSDGRGPIEVLTELD